MTGGPNEVWSYGPQALEIITAVMEMRERLRPYLHQHLDKASTDGLPAMRPLFLDFPEDQRSWLVEDQMMFGPDVLVAPVLEAGARRRHVYLPAGAEWTHAWSGRSYPGGAVIDEEAPLHEIPVYLRDGAVVPVVPPSPPAHRAFGRDTQ